MQQKPNILIIEDEQVVLNILTNELIRDGYKVSAAIDGISGLELINHSKPNLVLLDIILPKLNGFDLLKKIKDNPETKDIPVLVLSNLGQEEEIKKGKELGAVDYLVKTNVRLSEVMNKIKNIVKSQK